MQIIQDLNQINKKNSKHFFVAIGKSETGTKFQQKIFNFMIVGACQCSQFSKKIPGFSKTTELCLKFCVGFELHN